MATGQKISEQTISATLTDADYIPIIRSNGDSPETFSNRRVLAERIVQLKLNQSLLITMPDADYNITGDEAGYGSYFLNSFAISPGRKVTLDPAYDWCGTTAFVNAFTTESIDIEYSGGTPITLAGNKGCTALTDPATLVVYKLGETP